MVWLMVLGFGFGFRSLGSRVQDFRVEVYVSVHSVFYYVEEISPSNEEERLPSTGVPRS